MTVGGGVINLWVYGSIALTFSETFGSFADIQNCKLRITIKGGVHECEASIPGCDFDWEYNKAFDLTLPLYHLEGSGTVGKSGDPYTISLEASIYEVEPPRKGKKGAIGLEFVEPPVWSNAISFTMTIQWDA